MIFRALINVVESTVNLKVIENTLTVKPTVSYNGADILDINFGTGAVLPSGKTIIRSFCNIMPTPNMVASAKLLIAQIVDTNTIRLSPLTIDSGGSSSDLNVDSTSLNSLIGDVYLEIETIPELLYTVTGSSL